MPAVQTTGGAEQLWAKKYPQVSLASEAQGVSRSMIAWMQAIETAFSMRYGGSMAEQGKAQAANEGSATSYKAVFLHPRRSAASHLIRSIEKGASEGCERFKVRFSNGGLGLYPNSCLPIAGAIEHYRETGIEFVPSSTAAEGTYAHALGIMQPYDDPSGIDSGAFLDKVWRFDKDTHAEIVGGVVASLRRATDLGPGVLGCLEQCLNEVSDNVLVHAAADGGAFTSTGLIMAQVHRRSKRVAIAVYDRGMGIPASLSRGGVRFGSKEEALRLALRRGVTDGNGQGNGLWMLKRIVTWSSGSLEVDSDGVRYLLTCDKANPASTSSAFMKSKPLAKGTTLVDFQLDGGEAIDWVQATGLDTRPVDLWTESREEGDGETIRLAVAEEASGFATRYDGQMMRFLASNTARGASGTVVLDFAGIERVSFSFADEFVRKLAEDWGPASFAERFSLSNLSRECASVVSYVLDPSRQR